MAGPPLQDTLAIPLGPAGPDATLVESPLPGGISAVVRFFFAVPQWIQIGGFVIGVLAAAGVLYLAWRRRAAIRGWLGSRSRGAKIGLAAAVALLVMVLAGFSAASWNYMQHDNDFCVSCHVMTPAFNRFQTSEHSKLQCHDCHQQSIFASARQLYLWVLERPQEIGPHAPVPTRICAECHIQDEPDSVWQRISATAGHRLHLASDSSALENVQCVTCHGQEVHRFVPVDRTCGQTGCHDNVDVRLGKMADQTSLHCAGCHNFTAPVAENVSLDSAAKQLRPGETQCFGCHEMRRLMADFDPRNDPHEATCGMCHNPHTQQTPRAAIESCATAGCHAGADTVTPFHRGISRATLENCTGCHRAHDWVVQGSSCLSCHRDVFSSALGAGQVDGAAARGSGSDARHLGGSMPVAFASFAPPQTPQRTAGTPRAADSFDDFSHRRHRELQCTACHASRGRSHGQLTISTVRDCQQCHHAEERRGACANCHQPRELAAPRTVPSQMKLAAWESPQARALPFAHPEHRLVECTTCHTTPVTLAAGRDCASCHQDHHTAQARCRSCHLEVRRAPHTRQAHLGCAGSGCHGDRAVLALRPSRNVCEGCHQNMLTHRPGRECAACHQVAWGTRPAGSGP